MEFQSHLFGIFDGQYDDIAFFILGISSELLDQIRHHIVDTQYNDVIGKSIMAVAFAETFHPAFQHIRKYRN